MTLSKFELLRLVPPHQRIFTMISQEYPTTGFHHSAILEETFSKTHNMFRSDIKTKNELAKQSTAHSNQDNTPPSTPTTTSVAAHQLLSEVQSIYSALKNCSSLAPGPEVNTLLTRLVDLCIQPQSPACITYFFSLPVVPSLCQSLRPLCAAAEGELERHWTDRILNIGDPLEGKHPSPFVWLTDMARVIHLC